MYGHTIPGIPAIVPSVGVSAKLLKRDAKSYKVISVPKSAVPPLLKVRKVVIVASVPQLGNATIAIEARRWLKSVHHVYHALTVLRPPHAIGKSGNQ